MKTRQQGIALVIVLWVIALLTVIALSLTASQRTEQALTLNQLDQARFRALADGAIGLAALHLIAPQDIGMAEELWLPDGQPHRLTIDDTELEVRCYNEASRLDLNNITQDQLLRLLESIGIAPESIDPLTDTILDWRDPDDLRRLHGAEAEDYRQAGLSYGPRNGAFESVEELQQILGMSAEIYQQLEPHVRVSDQSMSMMMPSFGAGDHQRGSSAMNTTYASAPVIAALNNVSRDEAEEFIAERDAQRLLDPNTAPDRGGPVYRLWVSLADDDQQQTLEARVQLSPTHQTPLVILWRREGLRRHET